MTTPPTASILAGGRSKRMGQDKAGILWHGETLLARTARIAREAGCAVLIVGRDAPPDWPWPETQFAPDAESGQGPLAGLVTALRLQNSPIIALACDMPLLSTDTLRWLMVQTPGPHGVAVRNGAQWEPLFSLYQPAALPLMAARLAAGRRSLQGLLDAGEFAAVPAPPEIAAALVNVNTAQELAALNYRLGFLSGNEGFPQAR